MGLLVLNYSATTAIYICLDDHSLPKLPKKFSTSKKSPIILNLHSCHETVGNPSNQNRNSGMFL